MTALDQLLPLARLVDWKYLDVAAPPEVVWEALRHGTVRGAPWLGALLTGPGLRPRGSGDGWVALGSTPATPGPQILVEDPPQELVIGAIGRFWQGEHALAHVDGAHEFLHFARPGWVKVACALRALPRGDQDCRIELELRAEATDEDAWQRFRSAGGREGAAYFVRFSALEALAKTMGHPDQRENERPLPGDPWVPDATTQVTHGITIAATPNQIWPWLLQLGSHRGGYYAYDVLPGSRSARELHPELLALHLGQTVPATPGRKDGFEVLGIDPGRALVLGSLYDAVGDQQLPFEARRPEVFWQVSWAFVLEPLDPVHTRLHVRARAAHSPSERIHLAWLRPIHALMERAQLRHLKARVEGRLPADDWHDVLSGSAGAVSMALAFLSPFRRPARRHQGLSEADEARPYPGDERIPRPRWSWTHAIEIEAAAERVWPWVAQIGADRGGFYSYQWLENLVGCRLHNAEAIHPEWELGLGEPFYLHPQGPALTVAALERGRYFLVWGPPDPEAVAAGHPYVAVSWLFFLEPLSPFRCRVISRFRINSSEDVATRLMSGPLLLEPVGYSMDRRMLKGIKERVEGTTLPDQARASYLDP